MHDETEPTPAHTTNPFVAECESRRAGMPAPYREIFANGTLRFGLVALVFLDVVCGFVIARAQA